MNNNLRPNELRAKTAIIMFGIVLLVQTISLISGYIQYKLINELSLGHFVADSELDYNDSRQRVIAILYAGVLVLSLITFIRWFRRSYYNLHLKAEVLSYSEGWAAGSWFVPFINFVRPYKIMQELHLETNNLIRSADKNLVTDDYFALINLWWTLWITTAVVGNICNRMFTNPQTIDDYMNLSIARIIPIIVDIPFSIVAMVLIIKHSASEIQFAKIYTSETSAHNIG
jgi:hypothetical protein